MKLLCLSDIHGSVMAVQQLRKHESNSFDVIIIAGDISNHNIDSTQEIIEILKTFFCPILYVYGNWDYNLSYTHNFGHDTHHIHLNPFFLNGYWFVGLSGHQNNWGKHPALLKYEEQYRSEIAKLAELREAQPITKKSIEDHYVGLISDLSRSITDKRSSAYKREQKQLMEDKRTLLDSLEKEIKIVDNFLNGHYPDIFLENMSALKKCIKDIDRSRTIVITHDRLPHAAKNLSGVPLFLFGHRHGFSDNYYLGSRFINVSALQNLMTVYPIKSGFRRGRIVNTNMAEYVILEINNQELVITRGLIEPDLRGYYQIETIIGPPTVDFPIRSASAFELPVDLKRRLDILSEVTGSSSSSHLEEAILEYLTKFEKHKR